MGLNWPEECVETPGVSPHRWMHAGSNCSLDFHGDPAVAELVVFSDGNHHMALGQALQQFSGQHGGVGVFYATTPPGPLLKALSAGALQLGNLRISCRPHVFISPPDVMESLVRSGDVARPQSLFRSRGNVLLVRKDNPAGIRGVADLVDGRCRIFISNPQTEKVSWQGYHDTLCHLAREAGKVAPAKEQFVFGECIHHREAPEAVAAGQVDCAVIYFHLALRYLRIFPELFDIVPLGGSADDPQPGPGNVVSGSAIAIVGDGGRWGGAFTEFMLSETGAAIYKQHGMRR